MQQVHCKIFEPLIFDSKGKVVVHAINMKLLDNEWKLSKAAFNVSWIWKDEFCVRNWWRRRRRRRIMMLMVFVACYTLLAITICFLISVNQPSLVPKINFNTVVVGLRIHRLYLQLESKTSPKRGVLVMTLNCIWWLGPSSGKCDVTSSLPLLLGVI